MDPGLVGIAGILLLLLLLLTGMHAGLVLLLVGGVGLMVLTGPAGGLMILGSTPFATASSYDLSPLPLFLLMGAFASNGGLGALAFEAVGTLVGRLRGGLAIASTFGAAFFGLACGSSLAAAGVFTKAALPEMLDRGYDRRLAIGSIAAAGTFSTMLPPSGLLILYAIFTGESIGRLFMAGIVPGALSAVVYAVYIYGRAAANPALAPQDTTRYSGRERWRALMTLWPIVLLAGLVLGGIFAGWFTATEAGGIGAAGALVLVVALRGWRGARVKEALLESMSTNGMIFLIIIGAIVFGRFLSVSQLPVSLATGLTELSVPRPAILMGVLLMYLVLGMFLDAVAILAITLPVVFPLILALGFDPIWFAIAVIKVTEIGLVTPPVGMNVFVCVSAAEGRVTASEAFRGVAPFVLCDLVVLAVIVLFPRIALWLPDLMFG
jgi:C4-dicarboxylate transporter, DctM subunit